MKYQTSHLRIEDSVEIYFQLRLLFDVQKIYRQPDLTLSSLALKLDTNTKYLSQVINEYTDSNFPALLHRYRIREFIERLVDGQAKRFSFHGLAQNCGFSSRATFSRAFKNLLNQSPSEFLKSPSTSPNASILAPYFSF